MKNSLKLVAVLLPILLAISCEQGTEITPMPRLTRMVIESDQFKNLNIGLSDLNLKDAPLEMPSRMGKAIVISFRETARYRKIIGFLNESQQIVNVMFFEIETAERPEEISSSLEKGTFNGRFLLHSTENTLALNFVKSS